MQFSASKTDLLLQCARPFDPALNIANDAGEPAHYGSAFHDVAAVVVRESKMPTAARLTKLAARAAARYGVERAAEELDAHLREAMPTLLEWLSGFSGHVCEVELSLAYNPLTNTSRVIDPPTADEHHYDVEKDEMPGTGDVFLSKEDKLTVLDHKTGVDDFSSPDKLGQLKTLALAFAGRPRKHKIRHVQLAALHASRRGLAKVYVEEISFAELVKHRHLLMEQMKRIGDRSLRDGPECGRCPAREICPMGDGALMDKAEGLLKGSTTLGAALLLTSNDQTKLSRERRLGDLYEVIQTGEALAARARKEIKAEIERGVIPELPSGKNLIVKTKEVERLSKTQIIEAYGKLAAERLLKKLRRDGALMTKTEEYMTAVDD